MTEREVSAAARWTAAFTVEDADLEYLNNLLLEEETPLTSAEMARAIVTRRCQLESEAAKRRNQGVEVYLPQGVYAQGQVLAFPAFKFANGTVVGVRPGRNPDQGEFEVIAVDFGQGRAPREFATRLLQHKLNAGPRAPEGSEEIVPELVLEAHGDEITARLEARLQAGREIVRIAGRWFPRALLVNINVGHLNLAEAVLDMAGGGPLPPDDILRELSLPDNVNPRLQAFSLNYALQEDERFDEVGPAGQVLWFLRRLEPAEAVTSPPQLRLAAPEYDRSRLTETLLDLERELDDEWSPTAAAAPVADDVTVTLSFPHRRGGTLPLSPRLTHLFPTAYESPRIRLMLVDGESGEKFPAWVVRAGRYVSGLQEWYARHQVLAGSLLSVRRGDAPGEVVVRAQTRRPTREWVRTAGVTADHQMSFSMQKQLIGVTYDELMIIAGDNLPTLEQAWQKAQAASFGHLVTHVFRELAKLNPQSAVHAKSLYAAVNVVRRCPPGPIFAELLARPYYAHVGDAYWRFDSSQWTE